MVKVETTQMRLANKLEELLTGEDKFTVTLVFTDGTQAMLCDPHNSHKTDMEIDFEVGADYVEMSFAGPGPTAIFKIFPFASIKEIEYF